MVPTDNPISSESPQAMLFANKVCKTYGTGSVQHQALRGVTFTAETGEFIALRGPSGCGKSTLLHILGAMDSPTSGEVWLNGRRLDTLNVDQLAAVRRRHVGFVFQSFNLLPTLNAIENVSLPLRLDGVHEREARIAPARRCGMWTCSRAQPSAIATVRWGVATRSDRSGAGIAT